MTKLVYNDCPAKPCLGDPQEGWMRNSAQGEIPGRFFVGKITVCLHILC